MTNTSNDALVGALQEARKNRDGEDMSWIEDLADLPAVPTGERRIAVMISKRNPGEPEMSDQEPPAEPEEKAAHGDEPPKKKKKRRKRRRKKKKGKSNK